MVAIRPVTSDQLAAVMSILDEAACWLRRRGVDQWPCPHPPHFRERMRRKIDAGQVFAAYIPPVQEPVGTISLAWQDPYWQDRPGAAGYVHKMALRDGCHGQGLGNMMLGWAEKTAGQTGAKALRLDCLAANSALCRYYENAGFLKIGEITDRDYRAALFEKELS